VGPVSFCGVAAVTPIVGMSPFAEYAGEGDELNEMPSDEDVASIKR
jgi:hypothetical protein